jgi:hypothetical protein
VESHKPAPPKQDEGELFTQRLLEARRKKK